MQKSLCKKWLLLFLLTILPVAGLPATASAAELIATVDRDKISVDESLTLTIRYTGTARGEPDFSLLEKQFDLLSRYESTSFRSTNGKFSSATEWTLVLAPLDEGRLLIPSFSFDGVFSDAIEINVTAPQQTPGGDLGDVFLETVVNKSSAFVQEQILVTYRLYYSVNVDGRIGDDLKVENAIVVDLNDTTYQREVDGKLYQITEFNYAVFPQSSGELVIPSLHWTLNIANYRIGRIEKRRVRTRETKVEIKPQPASYPADATWLPAENIEISESWAREPDSFKVGEPITRTITLKADGLMSSQLPAFTADDNNSGAVKFYADQPKKNDIKGTYNVVSERIETAAVVVNKGGEVTIPGITIPWWDLQSNTLKYAKIPPTTVFVAGGDPASNESSGDPSELAPPAENVVPLTPTGQNGVSTTLWQLATVLFASLWLAFMFLWWRERGGLRNSGESLTISGRHTPEKKVLNQLRIACNENALVDIRKKLLEWAQLHWSDKEITTLDDIAERVDNSELQHDIRALDSALYSTSSEKNFSGSSLYGNLMNWLKMEKHRANEYEGGLGSLYPGA